MNRIMGWFTCPCGVHPGFRDWLRRLVVNFVPRTDYYIYQTEERKNPTKDSSMLPGFYIYRHRLERKLFRGDLEQGQLLLHCGGWQKHPRPSNQKDIGMRFLSAQAAEGYARRLRHGVPQGFELFAAILGISYIIADRIW